MNLTLEQKLGQLVIGQLASTAPTDDFRAFLRAWPLAGYRVHRSNIVSADQVRAYTKAVQDELDAALPGLPVIFASDEEGGVLSMFGGLVTQFSGNMALGASDDPDLAAAQAQSLAWQLSSMGINLDFAPVADTNLQTSNPVIGVRSFGDDPGRVARFVAAFEEGLHRGGVAGCAKHFPGHGNTTSDSHEELPVNHSTRELLVRQELPPFQKYIGLQGDSIMVSHVLYPGLGGPAEPASLNPAVMEGLLRQELGYDGVVMSDDLCMGAITRHHGVGDALKHFLLAGGDLALINSSRHNHIPEALEGLRRAVLAGEISEARIDRSVARVLRLKARIAGYQKNRQPPREDPQALAAEVARRSLTRLASGSGALPLRPAQRLLLVLPGAKRLSQADTSDQQPNRLAEFLERRTGLLTVRTYDPEAPFDQREALVQAATQAEVVLVGLVNLVRFPDQATLLSQLRAVRPAAALLLRDPYGAEMLPAGLDVLATYSAQDASMEALAAGLFGELPLPGRLPVQLFRDEQG